jgi:exopolysaccharide production protein ExoZ
MSTAAPQSHLHTIQALRGLSALWVLLYHAQLLQGNSGWAPYVEWASFGYLGVDIFFVISGFIMAMNTAHTAPSVRHSLRFALLRLGRVYSGWWPVFGLCLLGLSITSGWPADKDLWGSWWLSSINIDTLLLPVTWSLTFELYFYALIALSLCLPAAYRNPALALFTALVLALNLYWFSHQRFSPDALHLSHWGMFLFFSPLCLEFAIGYFCFRLQQRLPQHVGLWLLACCISGAVVMTYALHFAHHPSGLAGFFHYPERSILAGVFACCMLCLFLRSGTALPRRMSLWAGDISYILYLVHLPVIWSLDQLLPQSSWASRTLLTIATCLTAASVLHYAVEKPLYQHWRRWLRPAPQPAT